jgi:enoyl-[acyl-carrier-protein] reductase (NADH)
MEKSKLNEIKRAVEDYTSTANLKDTYYYYNRYAEADEVARVAVFLASDASSAVNGQIIAADSGRGCAALGETFTGRLEPIKPLSLKD